MSQGLGAGGTVHVVVPVKGGVLAKSRLRPPPGVSRAHLAQAIAMDTLSAVAATPGVHLRVVTGDPVTSAFAAELGAACTADPGAGLNAAIRSGLAQVRPDPGPAALVAVLLGDLPCLRPTHLGMALGEAACHDRAFVPDRAGTGTVLLTGRSTNLTVRFGPDSAVAHAQEHTRLDLNLPHLRHDIDDAADLQYAIELGLGPRTAAALGTCTCRSGIGA